MWLSFINESDHLKSKSDWVETKTLNSSQIIIGGWLGWDIPFKIRMANLVTVDSKLHIL